MSQKKSALHFGCRGGWYRYENNPIVGEEGGFTYDPIVLKVKNRFRMYVCWNMPNENFSSIVYCESDDGLTNWSERKAVMRPRPEVGYEDEVNRCIIRFYDGLFKMWYTSQSNGGYIPSGIEEKYENSEVERGWRSVISYAESEDGLVWKRMDEPVLAATLPWEKNSVMGPTVYQDEQQGLYRMWYSAGAWAEADAIGYAESEDGIHWKKPSDMPVLLPRRENLFEQDRVLGPEIVKQDDWYYLFYIGFENTYRARICLARSRDGVTNWERHPLNPLIGPGLPGSFDYGCAYRVSPWYDEQKDRWLLYYNGSNGPVERIGVVIRPGKDLWNA